VLVDVIINHDDFYGEYSERLWQTISHIAAEMWEGVKRCKKKQEEEEDDNDTDGGRR
jgi:hypothetical protein